MFRKVYGVGVSGPNRRGLCAAWARFPVAWVRFHSTLHPYRWCWAPNRSNCAGNLYINGALNAVSTHRGWNTRGGQEGPAAGERSKCGNWVEDIELSLRINQDFDILFFFIWFGTHFKFFFLCRVRWTI